MLICGNSEDFALDGCDTLICDPPYSAHVHSHATSVSTKGARSRQGKGVEHRDLGFDSLSSDLQRHIMHERRKVRRWSLVYSDVESLHTWVDKSLYVRTIPWVRWSQPQLSGDRPPQGFEVINLHHAKGAKRWNGAGNLVALTHACLRGKAKHPTEKPLDQLLDLVSWFSDPGELVVDLCAGSGTTAVACALLGREFFGVEKDAHWADTAAKREEDALAGQLSDRDRERVSRYLANVENEAPKVGPEMPPAYARATRRLEDTTRVFEKCGT